LGNLYIHIQNNEIASKSTSKWIKDLIMGAETVKLLGENMGEKFHDIDLGNDFFGYEPKSTVNKSKNIQMGNESN
jgi:hypothetical protein